MAGLGVDNYFNFHVRKFFSPFVYLSEDLLPIPCQRTIMMIVPEALSTYILNVIAKQLGTYFLAQIYSVSDKIFSETSLIALQSHFS